MACPAGAITSFPLQLGITATSVLYDSVNEPITMDFQWATRSTPPTFTDKVKCITDEVGGGNTNLTTLRFMNNNYTVASVQIIAASHTAWILPNTAQTNNKEDIVIVFATTSTTTTYKYITFVIPVLRGANGSPSYLTGLSNPNANGPFSLKDCFPTMPNARFAYYATCLAGYSGNASSQNSYVFVSTDGLQVSATLMTTILGITGRTGSFGTYSPPFVTRLTASSTTIGTIQNFTNSVWTTNQLMNYAAFKKAYPTIDTTVREDNTDAYKCVPIDPDASVVDGKLQVDLKTGETLTQVLAARDAVRGAHAGMDPGRVEKYMGTAIGIVLAIVLFTSIIWFAIIVFVEGGTDHTHWITQVPGYALLILITGFIGFIIGAMLN